MSSIREDWDVIVIGSGLGGLSCAGILAQNGRRVLVLEKQNQIGGCVQLFKRKVEKGVTYSFDVALQITFELNEGGGFRRILEEMGAWDKIKAKRFDNIFRTSLPDSEFTVPSDIDSFHNKLIERFPDEKDGIDSLFATMDRFAKEWNELEETAIPGEPPPADFANRYPTVAKYMTATLHEFVSDHVTHERVSAVFCQLWWFMGIPPKRLSAFSYVMMYLSAFKGGGFNIHGGGNALVRAMAECVEEKGGRVLTKSEVARILVEGNRCVGVETTKGKKFLAPVIVSNAPAPVTLGSLIDSSIVDPAYLDQVQSMERSLSVIAAYIGLKGTPKEIGFEDPVYLVHHTYDYQQAYDRILEDDYSLAPCMMINNTVANPDNTPEGRSIVEIMINADGKYWCGLPKDEYKKKKAEITESLIDRLSEIIPDIRERIEVIEVATPHTMERYIGSPGGSFLAYLPTPMGHSVFLPRAETPVPGLYLAGGWTFPGPAFHGSTASGATTAQIILNKE